MHWDKGNNSGMARVLDNTSISLYPMHRRSLYSCGCSCLWCTNWGGWITHNSTSSRFFWRRLTRDICVWLSPLIDLLSPLRFFWLEVVGFVVVEACSAWRDAAYIGCTFSMFFFGTKSTHLEFMTRENPKAKNGKHWIEFCVIGFCRVRYQSYASCKWSSLERTQ